MTTLKIDPREPGADIKMMSTPDAWPNYPVQTLKHKDEARHRDLGLLIHGPGLPLFRVWIPTLGLFDTRAINRILRGEETGVPFEDYAGAEEVFDAGWLVD